MQTARLLTLALSFAVAASALAQSQSSNSESNRVPNEVAGEASGSESITSTPIQARVSPISAEVSDLRAEAGPTDALPEPPVAVATQPKLPMIMAATGSLAATPPRRAKVIDKKFIIAMAALGGAETLRFTTHKLVLDNEYAAGAPWVTSVPANTHIVAKYSAIFAAEVLVAYEMKKPHAWLPGDEVIRKMWFASPTALTTIHIKNGVRSIRTQPPACRVQECGGEQ